MGYSNVAINVKRYTAKFTTLLSTDVKFSVFGFPALGQTLDTVWCAATTVVE